MRSLIISERTIVTNSLVVGAVLILYYFFVQASYKFGFLRKTLSTQENIYTPAATVDASFSKTTEHYSETLYARGCVVLHLYIFIVE